MRRLCAGNSAPSTSATRCNCACSSRAVFHTRTGLPLWLSRNSTELRASASDFSRSSMCANSVRSARMNFLRAGTL
ncbi:hypothetical protein RLIN73S_06977 [Rhodanobacter lindaniclasticus]